MEITPCKVCHNVSGNVLYTVREMQFGLRENFTYQQCGFCGCMQLQNIPADMARHYANSNYYSFQYNIKIKKPTLKHRIRASYLLKNRHKLLGRLLLINKRVPDFIDWMKIPGVDFHDKILDVGTGNGNLLADLYRYGFTNLTGIDPYLDEEKDYGAIKILRKSVFEIKGQWDYIMSHHSFEHMDEPLKVLQQMNKLLKAGGYLLIRMPVMGNYGWKTYGTDWVNLDAPRHLIIHTEKSMAILAGEAGFEVKKVVYDDAEAFSLWASEQYRHDIPLQDKQRSWRHNPEESLFTKEKIAEFLALSEELKKIQQGDQAAFYLYKPGLPV